ncbi:MAG: PAS domain-containing protein, partial [SAR324 cluster bacterium]|nr:PAS domain-containing protein [SAR324 cluster bacterium]
GLGELIGGDYDLVHSEPWEVVWKETAAAGGRELSGRETRLKEKGGEEIPVEIYLRIVPRGEDRIYIETVIDISDRKALASIRRKT